MLFEWLKWSLRDLNNEELLLLKSYCPSLTKINKIIRIDHRAYLGPSWKSFAYVSFHTINVWNTIQKKTFVHELIHLYQYQQEGPVYIPRALYAQIFGSGYLYGGINGLIDTLHNGKDIHDFNYEQQGDILADYYKLTNSEIYLERRSAMIKIYKKVMHEVLSDTIV